MSADYTGLDLVVHDFSEKLILSRGKCIVRTDSGMLFEPIVDSSSYWQW